jgi:p-hydroxybenzoate 3-monooxygenase
MSVVVVGAGPAGLVLSQLLHRAGISCMLLERHPRVEIEARQAKAGSIDFRTVELLTGVGLAPSPLSFEVENHRCEFRTPQRSVVFDYGAITGGRPHFIFPQHLLVGRLCDDLVERGGDVRFGCTVTGVEQDDSCVSISIMNEHGLPEVIACEAVVGCDGARSVVAGALTGAGVVEASPEVRLLALLAKAPPLQPHTIYAGHPRGYAGQMRRTPDITRYYLEVPLTDTLADWPEPRIREELAARLLVLGAFDGVECIEPTFVDLRMRMTTPMQDRRLFVAGDAAHLITPAGGKGMNLAIHDALELAHGFIERHGNEPHTHGASTAPVVADDRLSRYSETRLPAIWRTQAFSRWMLRMMMSGADDAGISESAAAFGAGLKGGWVASLEDDPFLASWFAHAYAGVDPLPV